MQSPLQAIPGICRIPSQTQVSGVYSHRGPCAVNRSIHSTKGMWNLAKGPPSQGAVIQLPGAYSGHWPLGYPVGPSTSPVHLTPLVPGLKPQANVLCEPAVASAVSQRSWKFWWHPSALLLAGPGTAWCHQGRLAVQGGTTGNPNQPQDSVGEMAIDCPRPHLHKLLGHSLPMGLVETCQQYSTGGPLCLSKHSRNKLSQKR